MRQLSIIIVIVLLGWSCAKPKTKDPVPHVEFLDLLNPGISKVTGSDTATMLLSYEDGDGDIFVDQIGQGKQNLVYTVYHFDKSKQAFVADFNDDPEIMDTMRVATTIKQPDDGYYKGKSIRGEIYVPMTSFRTDNSKKILKFTGYVVDMANHKSNIFSSPAYTLNF